MKATKKFDILPRTIMICGSGKKITPTRFTRFLESSSNTVKLSCAGHYVYLRVFEATLETSKGLEIQINRQIATRSHGAPQNL